jgi:hypothetical protein
VARLGVLLSGKEAVNESVRDSIIDLANYAVLLDMIVTDQYEEEQINRDWLNLFGAVL